MQHDPHLGQQRSVINKKIHGVALVFTTNYLERDIALNLLEQISERIGRKLLARKGLPVDQQKNPGRQNITGNTQLKQEIISVGNMHIAVLNQYRKRESPFIMTVVMNDTIRRSQNSRIPQP